MTEPKDEKRITLRVSPDLYDRILSISSAKNLTINAFIIQSLETAVDPTNLARRLELIEERVRLLTSKPD